MKQHTIISSEILKKAPFLEDATPIVRHHHERFDGKGYPDGLSGGSIPIGARILSVADSLDAMTSNRPYRQALNYEAALTELKSSLRTGMNLKTSLLLHLFPLLSKTSSREALPKKAAVIECLTS